MRPALAVVLAVLALVGLVPSPVSSAQGAQPSAGTQVVDQAMARLLPWLGADQQSEAIPAPEGQGLASFLDLYGLQDIDGDGKGEVLAVHERETEDGFVAQARALRGPGLTEEVWALAEEEAFFYGLPDIDGDGTNDVLGFGFDFGEFDFGYTGVPILPIGVYTFQDGYSYGGVLRSGRDASEVATLLDEYADDSTQAYAGAFVGGAFAGTSAGSSSSWWFGPDGTILRTVESYQRAEAGGYALVAGQRVVVQDFDGGAVLERLDGTVLASYEVTGAQREPVAAMPLANAQGSHGLVLAWREGVPLGAGLPLQPSSLHVAGIQGTSIAWELAWDPGFLLEAEMLPLPDLNGDGVSEAELLVFEFDPQAAQLVRLSTLLLDGADGSEIARVTSADRLQAYLPFGDLEGDGTPELLALSIGLLDEGETLSFQVVRADLTSIWGDATAGWPLNYPEEAFDETSTMADWSGDGAPDIVLREESGIRALDGRTGAVLWQRDLGEDDGTYAIGEATGAGDGDLAVVSITGVKEDEEGWNTSQAVATVDAIAGEDGRTLRRQVLRDPALVPAGDAGLDAYARGVGDVDGDGHDEFAVMVIDWVSRTVTEDGESYETEVPTGSAYVFSLRSDEPLLALAPKVNETTLAPAVDLPPAQQISPLVDDGGEAEAPLPLVVPVGALALALLRRRR